MSRFGEITLPFGGEDRIFRLGLGQMRNIQEKCDAGLPEIASRLAPMMQLGAALLNASKSERAAHMLRALAGGTLGRWKIDDYREPIFQGLIGGGMDATLATILVKGYVDEAPPLESCILAFQIAMAALLGAEDEPVGETTPPRKRGTASRRSRATRSASETSTPAAR